MLEPLATALVVPVIASVYFYFGIEIVFLAEGVLLLTAAAFETQITYKKKKQENMQVPWSVKLENYKRDLFTGIRYLKEKKGIRSIYSYMAISMQQLEDEAF